MSHRLKAIALLGALAGASPAWPMEDSGNPGNRLLFAQPQLCNRAWLMQSCPQGCSQAANCREAMVDHRLDAGDCMGDPVKAMGKVTLGCDACRQVFCR
jgi:hypothetical protein